MILLFILAVIGLTMLVVDSSIFTPVRDWLEKRLPPEIFDLFECHQCCGTWMGFLTGIVMSTSGWGTAICLGLGALGATVGWFFLKSRPHLILLTSGLGLFLGTIFTMSTNPFMILLCGGAGAFLAPLGHFLLRYMVNKVESLEVFDVRGAEDVGDGESDNREQSA